MVVNMIQAIKWDLDKKEDEAKLEERSSIALYDLETMFMCVWYSRTISWYVATHFSLSSGSWK